MNRTAETIRNALTMAEVAERYGYIPDRAGFIHCPFHSGDNQGSLKIYPGKGGGFCCFGCKASGSVIDFTMRLFEIPFKEACKKLSDDFNLGLYADRQSYRERKVFREKFLAAQKRLADQAKAEQRAEADYWSAFDLWRVADMMVTHYNPSKMNGRILSGYAEAVKSLPQLRHDLNEAEERRREIERATTNPGMGEG